MSLGDFKFSMITQTERNLPFYLIGAGFDFHQELDPHVRLEGYPHYQWIQVIEGEGVFDIDGKTFKAGHDQGILLFPDVPHSYYASISPWIVNWFTFNGEYVDTFLKQIHIKKTELFSVLQTGVFSGIIKKALKILRSTDPSKGMQASLLVYEFLVTFSRYAYKGDSTSNSRMYNRLNPVLQYIDQSYKTQLTIKNLSEIINVTPQYLCHLFRKVIKQRPIEYLNNVRINKSKDLLLINPHMKIEEISLSCGYESSSYFCSIFKKAEGMSPGKFRELHLHQKHLSNP